MNGRIKWKEKNRFKVKLLIENPPQIYITNMFPIQRMVETRFVITVAPQKDIDLKEEHILEILLIQLKRKLKLQRFRCQVE